MNPRPNPRLSSTRGSTIALAMVFTVAIGVVIAAVLSRAATESRLNRSAILHTEARLAAESAIQHGMAQLRDRFDRTQQLRASDLMPNRSPLTLGADFYARYRGSGSASRVLLGGESYNPSNFASYPTAVLGEVVNQNPINAQVDPMAPVPDSNSATVDALVREVRVFAKATAEDPVLGRRTVYAKKTFQVLDLSLFQYAVFYNHDLELWPGANMDLGEGGPIHVNGDAYLGANNTLKIHSRFTASGDFYISRHPNRSSETATTNNIYLRDMFAGSSSNDYLVRLVDATNGKTQPSKYLTSAMSGFSDLAREHYNGGLLTKDHNIDHVHPAGLSAFTELFPPGSGVSGNHAHNLIRPVENYDRIHDNSLSPQQKEVVQTIEDIKWSNKARLTMELSLDGGSPSFNLYTYDYDSDGKIIYNPNNTPKKMPVSVPPGKEFWNIEEFSKSGNTVTSGLYDYRQGDNSSGKSSGEINVVQIDVEKMREWVESTDSSEFHPNWWNGVVYMKMPEVADPGREDRVVPARSKWATQLVNGARIPNRTTSMVKGMTLATNGPLYVTGDYNAPQGGTSPSSNPQPNLFGEPGYEAPAALVADAITVLSNSWSNANSHKGISDRTASNTVVSAAFVTGLVPSASGNYSGGVENFPRFLENWNNKTLTYRGSMVSLFKSEAHTKKWPGTGTTYNAPNRNWGFHTGFRELPPPGDPGGRIYRQISFSEMSQDEFEAATNAVLSGGSSS